MTAFENSYTTIPANEVGAYLEGQKGLLNSFLSKNGISISGLPERQVKALSFKQGAAHGTNDLLFFIRSRFGKCFSGKDLALLTYGTGEFVGSVKGLASILLQEGRLKLVRFNDAKKFTFYALPEWVKDGRLEDKRFPSKLPNVVTSVTVVEGG